MTLQHTPGPWDWFTDEGGALDLNSKARNPKVVRERRYIVGANGQGLADTVGLLHEQDEANACLIAAAPDMLAALEAEEEWRGRDADGSLDDEWDYETMVGAKRRAAIAKATGIATE